VNSASISFFSLSTIRTHHPDCYTQARHPERSGPIFSSAPHFGASGRVVEGSLFDLSRPLTSLLCASPVSFPLGAATSQSPLPPLHPPSSRTRSPPASLQRSRPHAAGRIPFPLPPFAHTESTPFATPRSDKMPCTFSLRSLTSRRVPGAPGTECVPGSWVPLGFFLLLRTSVLSAPLRYLYLCFYCFPDR